ncbi:one cut domain family member 3-like [Montipora foliosa]|uniref:one cut domain family member 3-like n=1 Tax=Montipora foliosa TaxID=591990 RepID=UPI0035F0FEED
MSINIDDATFADNSIKRKITVEIPQHEEQNLLQFLEECGGKVCEDQLDASEEAPQEIRESPSTIASEIRGWLSQNRTVSVAFFAKEIVKRSQGTMSSLLNNPPQSFPTGAGREPWQSMKDVLVNPDEKAKLLDQLKSRKGKGKQMGETAESQETAPPKKTGKIFDKVELASLDAVYQASNGLPTNSMVERLAHSVDITKNQVDNWFQNRRRMAKNNQYTPGQLSLQ